MIIIMFRRLNEGPTDNKNGVLFSIYCSIPKYQVLNSIYESHVRRILYVWSIDDEFTTSNMLLQT